MLRRKSGWIMKSDEIAVPGRGDTPQGRVWNVNINCNRNVIFIENEY